MTTIAPNFAGSVPFNYDRYLGPILFEPYAIDMCQRLKHRNPIKVLELACGTGRVTKHVAEIIPGNGKLTATDLNADMIEVAKTRVNNNRVVWQVVDAQDLPFEDEEFDHIICQFGIMFFPDKLRSCKEAFRVLKKKGQYLFNTWDSLDHNKSSFIIQKVMVDVLGDMAPDFLQKGPFSMYDNKEIEQLVKDAGFLKIEIERVQKTAYYESIDDMLNGFILGSPLSAFLNELDEKLRTKLKEEITGAIRSYYGEGNHEVSLQALVCTAEK